MEQERIALAAEHYQKFCDVVGIDTSSADTKDTPKRVAKLFVREFTKGLQPLDFNFTTFEAYGNDLVSVTGMSIVSLCSHHHLPMSGVAHFGYLPNKKAAGLSKIPRLLRHVSLQPSVQEKMTRAALDQFVTLLEPKFAMLTITAQHSCMACRGVLERDARMTTTAIYQDDKDANYLSTKAEFLHAIDLWYKSRSALA